VGIPAQGRNDMQFFIVMPTHAAAYMVKERKLCWVGSRMSRKAAKTPNTPMH